MSNWKIVCRFSCIFHRKKGTRYLSKDHLVVLLMRFGDCLYNQSGENADVTFERPRALFWLCHCMKLLEYNLHVECFSILLCQKAKHLKNSEGKLDSSRIPIWAFAKIHHKNILGGKKIVFTNIVQNNLIRWLTYTMFIMNLLLKFYGYFLPVNGVGQRRSSVSHLFLTFTLFTQPDFRISSKVSKLFCSNFQDSVEFLVNEK